MTQTDRLESGDQTQHAAGAPQLDIERIYRIYRAARRAVRDVCPRHFLGWVDDLVQEVVIEAVVEFRRGFHWSRHRYRLAALSALRRIFGDERKSRGRREDYILLKEIQDAITVVHESAARRYARGLGIRRLQEVWASLTPRQRAGMFCMLTDPGITAEVAESLGTSSAVLIQSRHAALERIDDVSERQHPVLHVEPVPERPCRHGCGRMAKGRHLQCWICAHAHRA